MSCVGQLMEWFWVNVELQLVRYSTLNREMPSKIFTALGNAAVANLHELEGKKTICLIKYRNSIFRTKKKKDLSPQKLNGNLVCKVKLDSLVIKGLRFRS